MEKFKYDEFLRTNGRKFGKVVVDDLIKQNFIYIENDEYCIGDSDLSNLKEVLYWIYDNWYIHGTTRFYPNYDLEDCISYITKINTDEYYNSKTIYLGKSKQDVVEFLNENLKTTLISEFEFQIEDLENELEDLKVENKDLVAENKELKKELRKATFEITELNKQCIHTKTKWTSEELWNLRKKYPNEFKELFDSFSPSIQKKLDERFEEFKKSEKDKEKPQEIERER